MGPPWGLARRGARPDRALDHHRRAPVRGPLLRGVLRLRGGGGAPVVARGAREGEARLGAPELGPGLGAELAVAAEALGERGRDRREDRGAPVVGLAVEAVPERGLVAEPRLEAGVGLARLAELGVAPVVVARREAAGDGGPRDLVELAERGDGLGLELGEVLRRRCRAGRARPPRVAVPGLPGPLAPPRRGLARGRDAEVRRAALAWAAKG